MIKVISKIQTKLFLALFLANAAWSQNIRTEIEVYKVKGAVVNLTRESAQQNSTKLGSLSVTSKSGQQASAETTKEVIYVTAVNDGVPQTELRNAGLSFEFEDTLGADGYTIDTNYQLSYTSVKKVADWRLIPVGNQNVEDPGFVVRKLNSSSQFYAQAGWKLLGVLSNEGNEEDAENTYPVFIQVTKETP